VALGLTQPLTEMGTMNLTGGKGRTARKADNLTAICEPTVFTKCGSLDVSQPYGPSCSVTGIALSLSFIITSHPLNGVCVSVRCYEVGTITCVRQPVGVERICLQDFTECCTLHPRR
jgi:hypothetical protein